MEVKDRLHGRRDEMENPTIDDSNEKTSSTDLGNTGGMGNRYWLSMIWLIYEKHYSACSICLAIE